MMVPNLLLTDRHVDNLSEPCLQVFASLFPATTVLSTEQNFTQMILMSFKGLAAQKIRVPTAFERLIKPLGPDHR